MQLNEEQLWVERQIDWLKGASPDDWHRVLLDFNWDSSIDALHWIAQQPECDLATALTMFWLAQPGYYQMQAADEPGASGDAWRLVALIAERIHAGGYARREIAFDASPLVVQDYDELVAEGKKSTNPRLKAHPDMKRSIRGREVRLDRDFYQRYPEEFHGSVMIDLPPTDIVTPCMKEARSEVTWLIVNLVGGGALAAFLAGQGKPKPGQGMIWLVGLCGIGWCVYSSRASLQSFRGIVRAEHLEVPHLWIRGTAILSIVVGAGLGLAYRLLLMGQVQALMGKIGMVATIGIMLVVVLPLLWLGAAGCARVVVDRKTFR